MDQQIDTVNRLIESAVDNGDFPSRSACVSAMIDWLIHNNYLESPQLHHSVGQDGASGDDPGAHGIGEDEEMQLQREILRDRDA